MKKYYWIFAFLGSFLSLLVLGGYFYFYSLLPDHQGQKKIKSLQQEVEVYWDKYAIPHIFAQNQPDAYFVLGRLAAGERLFQMDVLRRLGQGRLSEIFGPKTLEIDKLYRRLSFVEIAKKQIEFHIPQMDKDFKTILDAYLKGINDYLENEPLPLEFKLLGYRPEKFTLLDMLSYGGVLAFRFAEGIKADPLFSDLLNDFSPEMVSELKDFDFPSYTPNVKDSYFSLNRSKLNQLVKNLEMTGQNFGGFDGSNSWLISAKRSKSNAPLLANDPHITFTNPSVWFEAHIHTPDFELYGHYVPLIPVALVGHNRNMGWTLTMSEIDDMDLYQEQFKTADQKEVMYKGEWAKVISRVELIKVKGQKNVSIVCKETPHGPLLPDLLKGQNKQALALKWAYYEKDNFIIESFYGLPRAKNLDEVEVALSKTAAPGINVSYADTKGNIAWWAVGKIPIRPKGQDSHLVLNGSSGQDEYLGFYDFKDNPKLINPDSGLIVTANYKVQDLRRRGIPGYWQPSERFQRIHQLLDQKPIWSLDELKKVQTDENVFTYKELVPVLLREVKKEKLSPEVKDLLGHWDGSSDQNSLASSIYHVWIHFILKEALFDKFGKERFEIFSTVPYYWHFMKSFIKNPNSRWWDQVATTDYQETRSDIITSAYLKMFNFMENKFGKKINKWNWKTLHTIEFTHFLGRQFPLNYLFNIGPYGVGGGYSQINNMKHKHEILDYSVYAGPSTRRLVDFAEPEKSWGILPTGNSGNVLSAHYRDQTDLFLKGKYRRQWLNKDDITKNDFKLMRFLPERGNNEDHL